MQLDPTPQIQGLMVTAGCSNGPGCPMVVWGHTYPREARKEKLRLRQGS